MKQVIVIIALAAAFGCGAEPSPSSSWRSGAGGQTTDGGDDPATAIAASLCDTLQRLEDQESELTSRPGTEEARRDPARARDLRTRLHELEQRQTSATTAP